MTQKKRKAIGDITERLASPSFVHYRIYTSALFGNPAIHPLHSRGGPLALRPQVTLALPLSECVALLKMTRFRTFIDKKNYQGRSSQLQTELRIRLKCAPAY